MQKPNKKYSNKIVVDEYEKIVQAHPPLKGPQVIFPSKFDHYQPVNNEEKQQLLLKVNQKHPNLRSRHHETEMPKEQKNSNQNFYELLSEDEEEQFKMLLERKHNKEIKPKFKNNQPQQKQQSNRRPPFKDSEYFPEEIYQQSQLTNSIQQQGKRPTSSIIKKATPKTGNSKQETLKKAISTSKFKDVPKKMNLSCQKQKAPPQSTHNHSTIKSNVQVRKPPSSQHDPILSKLKKKNVTLASKPLRLQDLQKNINPPIKICKIHSEDFNDYAQMIPQKKQEEKHSKQDRIFREYDQREEEKPQKKKRQPEQPTITQEQERQMQRNQRESYRTRRQHVVHERERQTPPPRHHRQKNRSFRRERQEREAPPRSHNRNQRENRQRPRNREQPTRNRQEERPNQRRNNRNNRNQSSTSRRSPNNFINFFSQTINQQLELMNNQFSMMSNIFENFSNFVNINIDTRGNHFHFESNMESSEQYDTDSSESYSSDYDDYYDNESQAEGLNQEELDMIEKIKYKVSQHGNNQCTICLIDLKNGDQAKKLFCNHIFHTDCIDEWLKRKSDCPVCRDKQ